MNKKDKKYRKNIYLIDRYIHDVYRYNVDVYTIIDMVQRFTPYPDLCLGIGSVEVFASILRKARYYFGGDSYKSSYCWHTRCDRDFLRRRRLLKIRIKKGGLK